MKRAYVVLLTSLVGLLVPTIASLYRSASGFGLSDQFQDDGRRYRLTGSRLSVPDSGVNQGGDRAVLLELLDQAYVCCSDSLPNPVAAVEARVLEAMRSRADASRFTLSLVRFHSIDDLRQRDPSFRHIALVEVEGQVLPMLIEAHDGVFVSGRVAIVGDVLYRRRYFEQDSLGLAIEVVFDEREN